MAANEVVGGSTAVSTSTKGFYVYVGTPGRCYRGEHGYNTFSPLGTFSPTSLLGANYNGAGGLTELPYGCREHCDGDSSCDFAAARGIGSGLSDNCAKFKQAP